MAQPGVFLVFLVLTAVCRSSGQNNCRTTCNNQPEGVHPLCGDCTRFLNCAQGHPTNILNCPAGLFFDPQALVCGFNRPAGCGGSPPGQDGPAPPTPPPPTPAPPTPAPPTPPPPTTQPGRGCATSCQGLPDGRYSRCGSCRDYLVCRLQQGTPLSCPAFFAFNPLTSLCDQSTICVENTPSPPVQTPPGGCTTDCFGLPNGRYGICGVCNRYVFCVDNSEFTMDCPGNTQFDLTTGLCNPQSICPPSGTSGPGLPPGVPPSTPAPSTSAPTTTPATGPPCMNNCLGTMTGLFALCNGDCTSFLVCFPNLAQVLQCPQGQYFNPQTSSCGPNRPPSCRTGPSDPRLLDCVRDCTGFPDGIYPSCRSCSEFVLCRNGSTFLVPCPDRADFSAVTGRCERNLDPRDCFFDRPMVTTAIPPPRTGRGCVRDCTGVPDGTYSSCTSCSEFVLCRNDITYVVSCPPNTLFSPVTGRCERNLDPRYCFTSPPVITAIPPSRPGPVDCIRSCFNVPDGNYPDCDDCRRVIVCTRNHHISSSCPPGRYFNATSRVCDLTSPADCRVPVPVLPVPTTKAPRDCLSAPTDCAMVEDGIYPDCGTCAKYYLCSGMTGLGFMCGPGSFFNRATHNCDSSNPTACRLGEKCLTTCMGMPDGIFADCTNCNRYFYCLNGIGTAAPCHPPTTIFNARTRTCQGGMDFSVCGRVPMFPTTTMGPPTTLAPNGQPCATNCMNLANGIYGACGNCTAYIQCIDNVPHRFHCPGMQRYSASRRGCFDDTIDSECGTVPVTTTPSPATTMTPAATPATTAATTAATPATTAATTAATPATTAATSAASSATTDATTAASSATTDATTAASSATTGATIDASSISTDATTGASTGTTGPAPPG